MSHVTVLCDTLSSNKAMICRSHTALDKKGKGGASGKGNKKQDKMEKPGTKDGRKSDMGNKGKDDKRKGKFIGIIFIYNS